MLVQITDRDTCYRKGVKAKGTRGKVCVHQTEIVSNLKLEVAYLWKSVASAGGLYDEDKLPCNHQPPQRTRTQSMSKRRILIKRYIERCNGSEKMTISM
jgi:hypothetical protein